MYKVFLNERLILIGSPALVTINISTTLFKENCTLEDIHQWFEQYRQSNEKEMVLIHPNPEYFFELFKSMFVPVPAAGGVVLRNDELLFIFRNGKWDLPKGKIDDDEPVEDAAIREVREECGISSLQIVKKLPSTFHIYLSPYEKSKGRWIFKETSWFEMKVEGCGAVKPQTEEGITEAKWFPVNQLEEVLANTYENLKQIIHLYLP